MDLQPSAVPAAQTADTTHDFFRALFAAEASYVCHTLRRLGVHADEVEDVAQEVFMVVYRTLADFDRGRPVRPWLFGISFRVASDHRKQGRHRHEVPQNEGVEVEGDEPLPDARLEAAQARSLLERALDRVDFDKRAVLVAHDIDGQPIPEVAASLGLPLNTAYSRLRLGRAELRAALQRLMRQPGGQSP